MVSDSELVTRSPITAERNEHGLPRAIMMEGYMHKDYDSRLISRISSAQWSARRYFAIVAFEADLGRPMSKAEHANKSFRLVSNNSFREINNPMVTHPPESPQGKSTGKRRGSLMRRFKSATRAALNVTPDHRDMILVWFEDKASFIRWTKKIEVNESEADDEVAIRLTSTSQSVSVLKAAEVLGAIHLAQVESIVESLRLDLKMPALEMRVKSSVHVFGLPSDSDGAGGHTLDEWLCVLNLARVGHVSRLDNESRKSKALSQLMNEKMRSFGPNKWVVSTLMPGFKPMYFVLVAFSLLWLVSLLFFLNPLVTPCQGVRLMPGDDDQLSCVRLENLEDLSHKCVPWETQLLKLGSWRSWVANSLSQLVSIDASDDACFHKHDAYISFFYWVLVVAEYVRTGRFIHRLISIIHSSASPLSRRAASASVRRLCT